MTKFGWVGHVGHDGQSHQVEHHDAQYGAQAVAQAGPDAAAMHGYDLGDDVVPGRRGDAGGRGGNAQKEKEQEERDQRRIRGKEIEGYANQQVWHAFAEEADGGDEGLLVDHALGNVGAEELREVEAHGVDGGDHADRELGIGQMAGEGGQDRFA